MTSNTLNTLQLGANQVQANEELQQEIQKHGLLYVLEDLEEVLLKLLVAEARDRLRIPVDAPVSKLAARQATEELWRQQSYSNLYNSTSHGINLQTQLRLKALRLLADDREFSKLLAHEVEQRHGDTSPTEPEL